MEKTIDKRMCLGLYFKTGLAYENSEITGITHLVEHMLFRRLNNIPNEELYRTLNRIGATLLGCTYPDGIQYRFVFNKNYIDTILDIASNFFYGHCWTRNEIELEKKVVLHQIDESNYCYEDALDSNYYNGSYYSKKVVGNKKTVKAITVDDVNTFANTYINASNVGFVLTGSYDEIIERKVNEFFHSIRKRQSGALQPLTYPIEFPTRFNKRKENDVVCKKWEYESRIIISFDVSKENEYMKTLLLDMLFLGDGSIIGNSLRERHGLTGNIITEQSRNRGFTKYTAYFDICEGEEEKAMGILFDEIKKYRDNDKSEYLKENINFYTDASDICSSICEHNTWIGYSKYLINDKDYLAENVANLYNKINESALSAIGKELLVKNNISISILKGDASTITKKQILKYWNGL